MHQSDFHLDLLWKHLFQATFLARVRIGDGFSVVTVLHKFLLATFDGEASNKMVRATARLLLQTVVNGGRYSEREAAMAKNERLVSKRAGGNRPIDLATETVIRVARPSLDKLAYGHTKKEAQDACERGTWKAFTQNTCERSLSEDELRSKARRTNMQRTITAKIPALLLVEGVFTPAAKDRVYDTIKQTRTFKIDPMNKSNLRRLRNLTDTLVSELDDLAAGSAFQREEQDGVLYQPNSV